MWYRYNEKYGIRSRGFVLYFQSSSSSPDSDTLQDDTLQESLHGSIYLLIVVQMMIELFLIFMIECYNNSEFY